MGIENNVISGFFAALAAVFTKVAFGFGADGTINGVFIPWFEKIGVQSDGWQSFLNYFLHIIFFILMLLANTLMIRFYIKSMQEIGAAKAVVYNFTVNYLVSIAFGAMFFHEKVSWSLGVGVVFILGGTALIFTCKHADEEIKTK